MHKELVKRIDDIKTATGLSQYEIAQKLGYDGTYLSQLLNDKKKVSDKVLEKVNLVFPVGIKTKMPLPVVEGEASHLQVIYKLADSNEKLSQANLILAKGNEELIQMTKYALSLNSHAQAPLMPLPISNVADPHLKEQDILLGKRKTKQKDSH